MSQRDSQHFFNTLLDIMYRSKTKKSSFLLSLVNAFYRPGRPVQSRKQRWVFRARQARTAVEWRSPTGNWKGVLTCTFHHWLWSWNLTLAHSVCILQVNKKGLEVCQVLCVWKVTTSFKFRLIQSSLYNAHFG